jgi:hypothetical protein
LLPPPSHDCPLPEIFHIQVNSIFQYQMRFSACITSSTAVFLLLVLIPASIASYGPGHPQLRHEERRTIEKRTFFVSLTSRFGKRDDCGTQFGPTYVDCGYDGCYQPSLGEICCGSEDSTFPFHSLLHSYLRAPYDSGAEKRTGNTDDVFWQLTA